MIYSVTEHWTDDGDITFFLDTDKVDPNQPFEVAYLRLLQQAAAAPDKSITTLLDGDLEERCSYYQEGTTNWQKLHAKPPCQVDDAVEVWVD